jgi:hypothetical protein
MSTALSSVEVCNLALDLLRHRDVVTSIEDPVSDTESICARWYDLTRRSVLRQFPWNFARKLITLSRNSTDPAFGYADAYNLPGDYIQMVFVGEDIDEDYETDFSIQSVCSLVGIEPAKKTFAEVLPASGSSEGVLRLARKKDSTCLYIRLQAEEGS